MRRMGALFLGLVLVAGYSRPILGDVAASPPGRLIFVGEREVTIMVGQGRVRRELPEGMVALALSPDGEWVAGILGGRVTRWRLSGGNPHALGRAPEGAVRIAWAPDGQRLAALGGKELYVAGMGGDGRSFAFPDPVVRAVWSATGRLAVETGTGLLSESRLWLVDPAAGEPQLLADRASLASWSPDGQQLAYALWEGGMASALMLWPGEQRLLDEASLVAGLPEQAPLFETNDLALYGLLWSPAGDRIVAQVKAGPTTPRFLLVSVETEQPDPQLWIAPLFLEHQRKDVVIMPPEACRVGTPRWVMGGSRLTAGLGGPGCEGKLAVFDPDSLTPVAELSGLGQGPLLASPEGDWLAHTTGGIHTFVHLNDPTQAIRIEAPGELVYWMGTGQEK